MAGVLSKDGIDQLLTAINADESKLKDLKPRKYDFKLLKGKRTRRIKFYDFKRPINLPESR